MRIFNIAAIYFFLVIFHIFFLIYGRMGLICSANLSHDEDSFNMKTIEKFFKVVEMKIIKCCKFQIFVMNFYEHNFSNLNDHRKCLFTKLYEKKLREKRKFQSIFSSQIFVSFKNSLPPVKTFTHKIQLIMSFTFCVLKLKIFLVRLYEQNSQIWGKLPEKVFLYTRKFLYHWFQA